MSKRRRQSLEDEVTVTCPHCFERQLLVVDPETSGVMVQDCDVCCRPWAVEVSRTSDGELEVTITRA
jgi:prolyl-tRNA synthetase